MSLNDNQQIWQWLQDSDEGPWHVINRLSAVSELEGQPLDDFTNWLQRLIEVATINKDAAP